MTSNIGARDIKTTGAFGFGVESSKNTYDAMKNTIEDAIKRVFNPEFLNRIDDTIVFHSLERVHINQIIDIQMKELVKRMATMNISIQINKQAKEFLADKGYDPAFGARPLRRAIQKYIEDPVAEELLRNKFGQGSVIKVRLNKKTDTLKFSGSIKKPNGNIQTETPQQSESVS
jgi:ATP-dependent Clp protease ATP-binding subunit ClpC